jgi:alpha-galactosidase
VIPNPKEPGIFSTLATRARNPDAVGSIVYLRAGGVSFVLDCRGTRLPAVAHWGADLGELDQTALASMVTAMIAPIVSSQPDEPMELGILAESSRGWPGRPGLSGHRAGRDWSTLFAVTSVVLTQDDAGAFGVTIEAVDAAAGLGLRIEIQLHRSGVLSHRAVVTNVGDAPYEMTDVSLVLPVPPVATELLDLTGRHLRERQPQRQPFHLGQRVRESRRGRPGLDASLLLIAGTAGFAFESGEVWGVHAAWSGDHHLVAERLPSGPRTLGAAELLLPGEMRLDPARSYATPWTVAAYGDGLNAMSARLHAFQRARPGYPRTPRPVIVNTWEAVYFDHDLDLLISLADRGAEVGAERFVLDDGWFRGRRGDDAGLGDWYVDETIWPEGLHPLVDHVRSLGQQFGLWVEPEMVNPDSDLARDHSDWLMGVADRLPVAFRRQQVLDLSHPDAFAYILERLDGLVAEYRIDYLKWDHNRDLVEPGHRPGGVAVVHAHTLAVYALIDELKRRHPGLEIESCASGGGRVDLGILARTDRIWASDSNDALERQQINRWTGLLVAPELIGAHVGANPAHTTSRWADIDFRCGSAVFGHFGIEMDLNVASDDERARLAEWIAFYKRERAWLHSSTTVQVDHPDPAFVVTGVVDDERRRAIFRVAAVATSVNAPPERLRLPGLDPQRIYRVALCPPGDVVRGINKRPAPWLADGVMLTGTQLDRVGVQLPDLYPEHLVLFEARAV